MLMAAWTFSENGITIVPLGMNVTILMFLMIRSADDLWAMLKAVVSVAEVADRPKLSGSCSPEFGGLKWTGQTSKDIIWLGDGNIRKLADATS